MSVPEIMLVCSLVIQLFICIAFIFIGYELDGIKLDHKDIDDSFAALKIEFEQLTVNNLLEKISSKNRVLNDVLEHFEKQTEVPEHVLIFQIKSNLASK